MPKERVPRLLLILFGLIFLFLVAEGVYYFYLRKDSSSSKEAVLNEAQVDEEGSQMVLRITERVLGFIETGNVELALPYFIYGEPGLLSQEQLVSLLTLVGRNATQENALHPHEVSVSGAVGDKGLSVVEFNITEEEESEMIFNFVKKEGDYKINEVSFQGNLLLKQ